jgi:hypothetical protein
MLKFYILCGMRTQFRNPSFVFPFLALFISGCGVTEPVRVLEPGEIRVVASIGGPVVPSAMPTGVVPYATVGAMKGLTDRVTVTGNVHALLAGLRTFGVDGGAAYRLVGEDGMVPEVTAKAQALVMTTFTAGSLRVFPLCSVNGSYRLGDAVLGYVGAESLFQFTGENHYFVGPLVGAEVAISRRVRIQAEAKWMAANISTRNGLFEGQSSFRGKGSFGFFLGGSYVW